MVLTNQRPVLPDVLLLDNVDLVPLIHIDQGDHRRLVRKRHNLENLLEAVILDGNSVDVGAVLGAVDINGGLDVISVVADQVHLIWRQHNVLEDGEGVGEFPVNFSLRK